MTFITWLIALAFTAATQTAPATILNIAFVQELYSVLTP